MNMAKPEVVLGSGHNGGSVIVLNRLGMVEWRGTAGSFLSHSKPSECLEFWENPHPYTSDQSQEEMAALAKALRSALS